VLNLKQEAWGGVGGNANGANAGHGGDATSTLTASNPFGGTTLATVIAMGGNGGDAVVSGVPGHGGDANAAIRIFGSPNSLFGAQATANATAGLGGINSTNGARGGRGSASVVSHVTTTAGRPALAVATVDGNNASSASARANTSGGVVTAMQLRAAAPQHPKIIAQAAGIIGYSFGAPGGNISSLSTALPPNLDVTTSLIGNPSVTAAYNPPDGNKVPLALTEFKISPPNQAPTLLTSYSVSASYAFDVTTMTSGRLIIGLLDPTSSSTEFSSLEFSIEREGTIVEFQYFTAVADANLYFNDRLLDLGPLKSGVMGTLDLTFNLEMTGYDNGARYGVNFLIADVGLVADVPGDYNGNGTVDAADYVLWRDTLGQSGANLAADGNHSNQVDDGDYTVWKSNFGQTAGSGANLDTTGSDGAAVPEPASGWLTLGALSMLLIRRYRHGQDGRAI
jgi:hypothetical protein